MDEKFLIKVADHMPRKLPRPTQKPLIEDGKIIPRITVTCEGEEW